MNPQLEGVYNKYAPQWRAEGWHVELSNNILSLHKIRKNGSPLKTAEFILSYEEYTHDLAADPNTGLLAKENFHKKTRPWSVIIKKPDTTTTFGVFEKALNKFLSCISDIKN